MGAALSNRLAVRKNRLRRRWGRILREIGKALSLVAVVGLLGVLMVFGYSFVVTASCFSLDKAVVRGLDRLSEGEILKLAAIERGQNILALNLREMAGKIRNHPWVKEACLGRELPGRIIIEIEERKGAGVVMIGGIPYMMDWKGEPFKRFEKGDQPDAPVFTGILDGQGVKGTPLVRESLEVLRLIRSEDAFPSAGMISEIHGDKRSGITLFSGAGFSVCLGFGNYERKLERAGKVFDDYRGRSNGTAGIHLECSNRDEIVVQKIQWTREREKDGGGSWKA